MSPRVHELALPVGDLDADGAPAGDRGDDPDVGAGHGVGDVVGQAGDLVHLDAGAELELVAGDGGADGHADEVGVDAELQQGGLERLAPLLDQLAVDRLGHLVGEGRVRRELPPLLGRDEAEFELLVSAGRLAEESRRLEDEVLRRPARGPASEPAAGALGLGSLDPGGRVGQIDRQGGREIGVGFREVIRPGLRCRLSVVVDAGPEPAGPVAGEAGAVAWVWRSVATTSPSSPGPISGQGRQAAQAAAEGVADGEPARFRPRHTWSKRGGTGSGSRRRPGRRG